MHRPAPPSGSTPVMTSRPPGAIALLAAAKPGVTTAQLRAAILGSTDSIPGMAGKTVTGGRLNISGAMRALGLSPVTPPVPPTPEPPVPAVLPFVDDFNQGTSPTLSGYWARRIGAIGIANQQATASVGGVSISTLNSVSVVDSISQAFVDLRTGSNVGLVARYTGGGDSRMYLGGLARLGTGFVAAIWRNTGTGWTLLAKGLVTLPSGVLRFEVAGSSLTLFFNGIRVTGAFDGAISGPGTLGIRIAGAGGSLDNYSAVSLTAPVPTTVTLPFSDSFTAPDNPYLPAAWTKRFGNLAMVGNTMVSRLDGISQMMLNGPRPRDSSVQAFVNVNNGTLVGLVARYLGPGDGRMYVGSLQRVGGRYVGRIWLNAGAGWTILSGGTALGGSGILRFDVAGTSLTLFLNNRKVTATWSRAIMTAGGLGIRFVGPGTIADNYLGSALTPPAPASVTSPFGDGFDRPDSNYVSGNWIQGIGNVAISGETVVSRIPGVSLVTVRGPAPRDSTATAVVNLSDGQSVWLFARHSGGGDNRMYIAGLTRNGDRYFGRIWRNTGYEPWRLLASTAVVGGSGRIRFDCIGSSLTLYLNGHRIAAARDCTIPGPGTIGLRLVGDGTTVSSYAFIHR